MLLLRIFVFAILIFATGFSGMVYASTEVSDAAGYWRDKPVPEKAEVSFGVKKNGKRYRLLTMPGVTVTQYEDGSSMAMDTNGNGGVMCAWEIYTALKVYVDTCNKYHHPYLDEAVERISDFIVKNSDTMISEKISKPLLEKKMLQKQMTALEHETFCETSGAVEMARGLENFPEDKMREEIDKLLSVPRIPVMNPCF